MKLSRPDVQSDLDALVNRIRGGLGATSPEQRGAAVDGRHDGPLATYLDKVRFSPTSVTDEEVARLRAAGHSDDELFELTVATALGASHERLMAGLRALADAYGED